MHTFQGVAASHEDLDGKEKVSRDDARIRSSRHTLSNAVEHARGCVATKMGLLDILSTGEPARLY